MTGLNGPHVPPSPERMALVMSTIAAQARRTNLVRTAEIRAALDRAASDTLDDAACAAAERTAHQLAGSAGTFGFPGVSERARYLERFFADAAHESPDRHQLGEARVALDQAMDQLSQEPELD